MLQIGGDVESTTGKHSAKRGRDALTADQVDVLVVGAGPAGLFAAAELARHGVRTRVIERATEPHHEARATAIQPGTLEILAQVGLLDEVLASSVHLGYARLFNAELQQTAELSFAETECEWPFQCSIPQWRTEEILTERLIELGGGVERGVEALSLQAVDDGVLVRLRRPDGTPETIVADWVLGAGGAHSITRDSMAQVLVGDTYPGVALVAEVAVSGELSRDGGALIGSPDGYVFLSPLPEDRWISFVGLLEEPDAVLLDGDMSATAIAAAIERRVGTRIALDDVGWAAPFRMHRRIVRRLADHRQFLLGDAGHLSSPFGGEGLNSGFQDAYNIAWKLALELRGHARPPLLESYGPERMAADRHVLEVSDQIHELATSVVESARTGAPLKMPPPEQRAALVTSRAMLDVTYAGTPLVGEHIGTGAERIPVAAPGDRYPDRASLAGIRHHLLLFGEADKPSLARLRRRWEEFVEVAHDADGSPPSGPAASGALLIRPDGHVGFRVAPADEAGLRAVDAHLSSYVIPK